jgi:hypothetical protein
MSVRGRSLPCAPRLISPALEIPMPLSKRLRRRLLVGLLAVTTPIALVTYTSSQQDAHADVQRLVSSLTGADGRNYTVTNNLLTSAVSEDSEDSGTRKEWLLVWAGDENIADTAVATARGLPGALNVDVSRLQQDVVNVLPGPDFLAVIDATKGSSTYGQVVNTATVGPLVENEPHHMQYIWHKGDKIFAGGLFTAATYVFNVAKLPELSLSGVSLPTQTLSGSVPDAYWVLEDGTAYGTYMGGPVGARPLHVRQWTDGVGQRFRRLTRLAHQVRRERQAAEPVAGHHPGRRGSRVREHPDDRRGDLRQSTRDPGAGGSQPADHQRLPGTAEHHSRPGPDLRPRAAPADRAHLGHQ